MSISEEQVKNALKSVKYPGFTRDIISFGLVKSIDVDNGEVKVQLALATMIQTFLQQLKMMPNERCARSKGSAAQKF